MRSGYRNWSCCIECSVLHFDRRKIRCLGRVVLVGMPFCLMFASCAASGSATAGPSGGKGAPWTILCLELFGDTRTRDAQRFAETLRNTPGIRANEVYFHDDSDGYTRLYYGDYRWPPPKNGKPAPMPQTLRNDLTALRQLGDASGQRYFLRAVAVRKPTPNVGNPEWALSNAQGFYTLQVAVFEPLGDFLEFKQAAAEYCKLLREKGFEAYYYHANAASLVTVGVFGADAVIQPSRDAAQKEYITRGVVALPVYSAEVRKLQREELLQYNLHNGGIRYSRGPNGERVPEVSQLVEIPRTASLTNVPKP